MKHVGLLAAFLLGVCVRAGAEEGRYVPHVLTPAERRARVAEFSKSLAKVLDRFEQRMSQPNQQPSIRDLPNAALAELVLGRDPRTAEKFVDLAFAQQDMGTKSASYGSVPWQIGHPEIHDENAIDFATQAIGPMLIHYGDKLSPEFKQRLQPHIKASFAAMLRRNLKVSYTNIWLMRTVNMILMGEAVKDEAAASEGYRELDQWIDYTRQAGIHEFDSNTYYFVDLDALDLGYLYAARPEGRAKFKAVLDYFWSDIAANYFAPNGVISGPMSRNYGFLTSQGGLDVYMYVEGLRETNDLHTPDFEKTHLVETAGEQGYHIGEKIVALANEPNRIVRSRWDAAPDHDRYACFTPDFAIGSASGDYNAQDKLITVEFAGVMTPVMTVVPDIFDSPYGTVKSADGSGHMKPTHIKYRPLCVQEKGSVLALLDLDTAKTPATASLATNILLPMEADRALLNGKPVALKEAFEIPVPPDSVIALRSGRSGVAIRVFHVDPCAGAEPQIVLKLDPEGIKNHTARLAIYHYRGESRVISDKHIGVGLMILAQRCESDEALAKLASDAAAAQVNDQRAGNEWKVEVKVRRETALAIARDLKTNRAVAREVNGKAVESAVLSVNGRDLAALLPAGGGAQTLQPPAASPK